MNRFFSSLTLACALAASMTVFAQDQMQHDTMKQDDAKHDTMKQA